MTPRNGENGQQRREIRQQSGEVGPQSGGGRPQSGDKRRRAIGRRYRRLLRFFFPAAVRAHDGADMEATFLRILEIERNRRGRIGVALAWIGAVGDGIRRGWLGRRNTTPRATRSDGRWSFSRAGVSLLDAKLGVRMLAKNPGLTTVAVFALAVGIPIGLAPRHLFRAMEAPLPVPQGDRVLLLRHWDVEANRAGATTYFDYLRWGDGASGFGELGAFRRGSMNVGVGEGDAAPVSGAEITASSFGVLRVTPLHGRALGDDDEVIGAPNVVVIGHDLWQARFGGDPDIIGRSIHVSQIPHTVVGVMPSDFRFPINEQLWLPLREQPTGVPVNQRSLTVFGRLAETSTAASAEAALRAAGEQVKEEHASTYARLNAEVVPFSHVAFGFPKGGALATPEFYFGQTFTLVLLVIACANVAMLMFARAATRSSEFAVRTALGASRARVVTQMFTESLVLAVLAAGVGLTVVDLIADRLAHLVIGQMPYWIDLGMTWWTSIWAVSLAVLSAGIAGVIPALRVTGKRLQRDIQRASAGFSGVRLGGLSSVLIVADVAVSVGVVGLAVALSGMLRDARVADEAVGIPANEYLAVELRLSSIESEGATDTGNDAFRARLGATVQELVGRIEAEPGVRAVAVADALPRMNHRIRRVEIEGEPLVEDFEGHRVRRATVDVGFFRALNKPVLTGRDFDGRDLIGRRTGVIVNTNFVTKLLGGEDPIGKRFRYRTGEGPGSGPWYEIVGVVGPLGMHVLQPDEDEGIYHAAAPGEFHPVQIAVHAGGDPASLAPRLRRLTQDVDRLAVVVPPVLLSDVYEGDWYFLSALALGIVGFVGILLALAASGLYAIMSVTVAQRTREIGIRTALGARRGDVVMVVARRAIVQLAVGVALGMPLAAYFFRAEHPESTVAAFVVGLAPGIAVMVGVGLLACGAPTLRALRVVPTEALR